ncbi:hypothetical protein [Kitasatospora viridis]|uniref:Uncharacterized protein n=1 Tax=Kitasatospora viridis TaxID=281105 RepID=A0A561UBT6_9ACTN|nr:hypothetical protein [Kitasatospora viridis]TWF96824.1 hypothetical protein FHX73_11597 [Kitasatospora viridis]
MKDGEYRSEPPRESKEAGDRKLAALRTPEEIDAGFERGDPYVGTAVIRLVFNCTDFGAVAARVERALRSDDLTLRGYGCVAAGDMTRMFGRLSPGIWGRLRELGFRDAAADSIGDALTFIPFRHLPPWFKWQWVRLTVVHWLVGRRFDAEDWAERVWKLVRRGGPR